MSVCHLLLFAFLLFCREVLAVSSFLVGDDSILRPTIIGKRHVVGPQSCSWRRRRRPTPPCRSSSTGASGENDPTTTLTREENKQRLLDLVSQTPRNAATPRSLTNEILPVVRNVEADCPSADLDASDFLGKLKGTWDLLWTSQDPKSRESQRGPFSYINPLENQSYSNNPRADETTRGRANPLLPREIQDRLEAAGILKSGDSSSAGFLNPQSTQSISLSNQEVRNVVSISNSSDKKDRNGKRRAAPTTLTIAIDFEPNEVDDVPRRIDVTFKSCRVVVPTLRLDFVIPLQSPFGLIKPVQGWLRTTYLDDDFRITRGHKGSVFILARPGSYS